MTKKTFKTIDEYKNYLELKVIKVLEEIGDETLKELQSNLQERVYDFTPKMYERTGELMDSLTCTKAYKVGDYWCVKIFYDTKKINSYYIEGRLFNQHSDYSGNSTVDYISLWIEEGTSPINGNFYPREGIHSISEEAEWLKNNFTALFKAKLKKRGIISQ